MENIAKNALRNMLPALVVLGLLGGCTDGLFNQDLTNYEAALTEGEFETQIALATTIIATDPALIELSQTQIEQAKTSFTRLSHAEYVFADPQQLKDAQTVLAISPNTEIAKKALRISTEQQNKQQQIKQQFTELYQIETGFSESFHLSPLHKKTISTSIKLPPFVGAVSDHYYLGALNKRLKNKTLNDYQLRQLMNHQNDALSMALALNNQLQVIEQNVVLSDALKQTKQSLAQVIALHQQTMDHLLVSLIRDGIKAAEKSFKDISLVAGSQMTHGNFDKVWEQRISPLTRKQWKIFDRTYLKPISTVRQAILQQKTKTDIQKRVLSQTFPHAKLTYKYFWPEDDLLQFTNQAPQRKHEAKKISKVLDGIEFDEFVGINQSYQALMIPG